MEQTSLFEDTGAQKSRRPTEPIIRSALVEGPFRFWAKRAWGAGPMICWGMLNPSDANGQRDDPTMWRVMEFSMRWGFGSCVVINPYPLITPDPKVLHRWRAGRRIEDCEGWHDNVEHCARETIVAAKCVAAWGNGADGQDLATWLEAIAWKRMEIQGIHDQDSPVDVGYPAPWICLGLTQSGMPKHPLARGKHRVPPDFEPIPFKADWC